jgi:hypothetical protein
MFRTFGVIIYECSAICNTFHIQNLGILSKAATSLYHSRHSQSRLPSPHPDPVPDPAGTEQSSRQDHQRQPLLRLHHHQPPHRPLQRGTRHGRLHQH